MLAKSSNLHQTKLIDICGKIKHMRNHLLIRLGRRSSSLTLSSLMAIFWCWQPLNDSCSSQRVWRSWGKWGPLQSTAVFGVSTAVKQSNTKRNKPASHCRSMSSMIRSPKISIPTTMRGQTIPTIGHGSIMQASIKSRLSWHSVKAHSTQSYLKMRMWTPYLNLHRIRWSSVWNRRTFYSLITGML